MHQVPQIAKPLPAKAFLSKYQLGTEKGLQSFLEYTEKISSGITTGIGPIDDQFLGLQGIVGIVGEPKVFKSTLALQIALHNAKEGNPVLFVDRENGQHYMERRIICSHMGMSWERFTTLDRERRSNAYLSLSDSFLRLHTKHFSMDELEADIDAAVEATPPGKKALLVLDSLHKLPMQLDNMRMSVDGWLLFLDRMKLKHDRKIVIIVTCEKRRGSYGEAVKDAAKESGRIEYTLEMQFDMRSVDGNIILECMYNRHGPSGRAVYLHPQIQGSGFVFRLDAETALEL